MTEEQRVEYAASLMLDHARRIEYTDIFDMVEDLGFGDHISEDEAHQVFELMCEASITVVVGGSEFESGPDDDDEDEGGA